MTGKMTDNYLSALREAATYSAHDQILGLLDHIAAVERERDDLREVIKKASKLDFPHYLLKATLEGLKP